MNDLSNYSILVVDDEEDIIEILTDELEDAGFQVNSALNANDAFQLANQNSYHVILSDTKMPNGDGIELLSNLKRASLLPKLFYFVSGQNDYSEQQLKEFGAFGLISKPFEFSDLIERLKVDIQNNIA